MEAKHLAEASSRFSVANASLAMIFRCAVSFVLFHLSSALFELCDETFNLDTDANVTISSADTLNARNATSCRYTLIAPVNSIVEINCLLDMSQAGSETCPIKRFFVSVDGMRDLRGADYFCSRNGSKRTVRRRSVMNRLVVAYATKAAVGDEGFACVARRISSRCDCGWSRRVEKQLFPEAGRFLIKFRSAGENLQWRRRDIARVPFDTGTCCAEHQPCFLRRCNH